MFNTSLSPCNRYWDNLRDGEKDYAFWKNSRAFFNSQSLLKSWVDDATSAFLIPWRTDNIAALEKDPELKQKIHEYSGRIVRKILEHHRARILILSGVSTLKCLASDQFLSFDWRKSVEQSFNRGPNYQCRKVNFVYNHEHLTIFQIPHFSRANSQGLLTQCSSWLLDEILKLRN